MANTAAPVQTSTTTWEHRPGPLHGGVQSQAHDYRECERAVSLRFRELCS
jgi:hypothetical protein